MQQVEAGAGLRRSTMNIAISNTLALARWHGMRQFERPSQNDIILWVVAAIAASGLVGWAMQKRKRRWFKR
jgi:hypothetical protein